MTHEKIIVELELDDILPNRFQPRIKYPEQAITELAESIKEHGVIQPILVRRIADKYEIIAGERRYKASLLAGKKTIPAIISDLNDKDSAEVALIENVQRQDLTPIEEAVSYRRILDMGYLTQEQLAEKLGKNQSTISNKLRLLNLDDDVQEALLDEKISERHARSLLKLDSKQKQKEILNRIIMERLTVKKTDELITKILTGKDEKENTTTTEIPSIFMNNSVQVEEPAIQSSSAIEFINQNNQVVNSFTNNTKDSDLIDFLNVDNSAQQTPTVPVEEVNNASEINVTEPIQNYTNVVTEPQNFTKFDIPSSPIIEEMEDDSNQMPQMYNNSNDLKEIDDMLNNFSNKVNPGFVDVDSIQKNAKDIYVEKPLADIDNLLMSQNGTNNNQTNFESNNSEINEEQESPLSQNKFFTMIAPEETTEETNDDSNNNSNEEVFNFTPNIENAGTLNQFLESAEKVEPPKTENISNITETKSDIDNIFTQPTPFKFDDEEIKQNDVFEPTKIENVEPDVFEMQDNIEEIDDIPKTINYPADNNLAESIRKEEVVQVQNVDNNVDTQVDLKTIINTIRNCSDTIEKFGYAIECEEYDFEDMYQVIFKIQKKD